MTTPSHAVGAALTAKDLWARYRCMLLIRRFEEKAGQLYGMGLIGGFCHLYIGQEAVIAGLQPLKNPQDTVITSYRDHGHMLACGMDPRYVMSELTGRKTGYSKGKGGSMHMFSREQKFFGGHGIVGAQIPIGTGLAFGHQYADDGGVCFVYLGDGASNQGQFFESLNMAALWKLPALYIIENNHYAMGTAVKRACAEHELFRRGEPFGIPGRQVDGMDVCAVHDAACAALQAIRSGQGPQILEMITYRYRGHSMSDPATYRTRDEVDHMRKNRDPLETLKTLLREKYQGHEEAFKAIEKDVKSQVQEAAQWAQDDEWPDINELWTDVYVEDVCQKT